MILIIIFDFGEYFAPIRHSLRFSSKRIHAEKNKRNVQFSHKQFRRRAWAEKEIVFFPNGVDDAMLAFVLERLKADKAEQILLYICTLTPVADEDKSVWLGGYEVRRSLIEAFCSDVCAQVIYDCGRKLERNEKIELEKEVFENKITSLSFEREGE